jgi:hypothetical protein
VVASWSILGHRDLRFHILKATDAGDEVLWGGKPGRRIG